MATVIVLVNFVWSVVGLVLLWKCSRLLKGAEGEEAKAKAVKGLRARKSVKEEVAEEEPEEIEIAGQTITRSDMDKILKMIDGGD